MLYKTLVAAFVVSSGDALRIDGLNTRRAAIASAASALSLVPLAAFAELKQAGDAEIYERAREGKLNAARVRPPPISIVGAAGLLGHPVCLRCHPCPPSLS
tara:strand:+ start:480 stop:782 length:303 start_codon:yes stop_codon:yes gene_type:complete